MRAGAAAPDRIAAAAETPDVLAVAIALRWERPDLTGQLADHVVGVAEAAGDRDHWLRAAGWAVHARTATGDGRTAAATALEGVRRWGAAALAVPAAYRLRTELALVAIGTGQTDRARALLAPVAAAATSPLVRADARTALARCAMEDAPHEVMSELRNAHAAWSEVRGHDANLGLAATELVAAAAHRRAGRPDASAAAATAGLSRLRGPVKGSTGTPSGYLSAALTTEWISALLDTGRVDEAQDGCEPLFGWLGEPPRPCRQLARLRLTVARAVASGTAPEVTAEALAKAAQDAADSDAPDLEVVSRSALGALLQQLGRADEANAAILLAAQAERRDKHRDQLFRAVLGAATVPGSDVLASGPGAGVPNDVRGDRPDPRDRLPARGPRVGGIDALAPHGLGARDSRPAPSAAGGTGALATPPAARSGPAGRGPVDPTATVPRQVDPAAAAPQNGRPSRPEPPPASTPSRPTTSQWPWVDVAAEPSGNGVPATKSSHPVRTGPDDPRAPDPNGNGLAEEAAVDASEGIVVSWPPLPSVAEVPAEPGDQRFDWPWAGRPGDSPIGDLLMDRLRANRAVAQQEGARRARHGSPHEGSDAASISVDGGSHLTAGPARNGPDPGAGPRDGAAGSPNGRPPDAGAARPPAHTAQPAPPRPSDNPWTTGSWAGQRSGSRPVPATNAAPSPGGSPPAGEALGEVARNVAVPPASTPSEVVRGSAAGGGMPPVGFQRSASAAVSEAGSGDAVRRGAAAQDPVLGVADGGVVLPEPAPPETDRKGATGCGDAVRGGAAARDLVRGVAGTEELPLESAIAEWRRDGVTVSEAASGNTARGGPAARDSAPGAAGGGGGPAESDRAGVAVPETRTGDTAPAGAAASELVPDAAASFDAAPAQSARIGAVASGARSAEATTSEARDALPAAARGEVVRGIATALDAALIDAVPGGKAPGNPPARGVESGEPAPDVVAPEDTAPGAERLRGALEDVDRAWNLTFGEPTPPAAPVVEDCRIVIDVARDGRRFAGPRAAAVLRTIAGRLHLQLPAGARVGTEPHDGLVIEIPSVGYGSAARWMNRTLPGLLDGLTFDDDFARLHLRSVVYGADGPVGAQVLVRLDQTPLDSPSDRSSSPGQLARQAEIGDPEMSAGVGLPEPAVSTCGCPTEAALPVEQAQSEPGGLPDPGHHPLAAGDGGLVTGREMLPGSPEGAAAAGNGVPVAGEREWTVGNGSVPAGGAVSAAFGGSAVGEGDGSSAVGAGGLTAGRDSSGGHGAPVVGRDGHDAAVGGRPGAGPRSSAGPERSTPDEATAPTGRHAATDRTPFRPSTSSHNPGHEGRRHRPDPETPARPGEMPDTDGLGLADLLAGALAAYRGI